METRIPSGMRDLIGPEADHKRQLQQSLLKVFKHYGYTEVMTPAIEYLQTYSSAFSSLKTREMFKFFDEDSEIIGLRMDMTVPIARLAATRFKEAATPLRFCYASNVYKVRKTFAGKRSEVMDCGIERIGGNLDGDLEVLFIALQAMDALEAEDALLEISDVNFFFDGARALLEDESEILKLAELIDNKSMVELESYLKSLPLTPKQKAFFMELPILSGGPEALVRAAEIAFTPGQEKILKHLASLYDDLSSLDEGSRIRIDMGKVPHLDYYTGLMFEGYLPGVGTSILSGGRYDRLLESFGDPQPAVGFSVKIDYLIDPEKVPEKQEATISYGPGEFRKALEFARDLDPEMTVHFESVKDEQEEVFE